MSKKSKKRSKRSKKSSKSSTEVKSSSSRKTNRSPDATQEIEPKPKRLALEEAHQATCSEPSASLLLPSDMDTEVIHSSSQNSERPLEITRKDPEKLTPVSTKKTLPAARPKPRPLVMAFKPDADDVLVNLFTSVTDEVCFCQSVRKQEDIVIGQCGHTMCINCFLGGCPLCAAEKGMSALAASEDQNQNLKMEQYSVFKEMTLGAFHVGLSETKYELNLQFMEPSCNA